MSNKNENLTVPPKRESRPTSAVTFTAAEQSTAANPGPGAPKTGTGKSKKKRHGKGKRKRKQSFAAATHAVADLISEAGGVQLGEHSGTPREGEGTPVPEDGPPKIYRLGNSTGANLSDSSLASEALLDHRDHPPLRQRRESRVQRPAMDMTASGRGHLNPYFTSSPHGRHGPSTSQVSPGGSVQRIDMEEATSRTPLLGNRETESPTSYGFLRPSKGRSGSDTQSNSSSLRKRRNLRPQISREISPATGIPTFPSYDVNNPPSMPGSPRLGANDTVGFDDLMIADHFGSNRTPERRMSIAGDHLIDIDGHHMHGGTTGSTPRADDDDLNLHRRHTLAASFIEGDVCFPQEGMSEIGEEYIRPSTSSERPSRRKRMREWPDLSILEEYSREERELRVAADGGLPSAAKKISEPMLVEGRLRPLKQRRWYRSEEDAPYRFTYFNEERPSTIHAPTISELLQPDQTFRDLFIPDPPELSDSDSDEELAEEVGSNLGGVMSKEASVRADSRAGTVRSSIAETTAVPGQASIDHSGEATPARITEKPKRYGARPTFWLDVLSPTETEMRIISKAFGIHPLTAEDILTGEAREKVELFRNYYFVNYRTFEQDQTSEDYLEAVNMYVVVFRWGVLSFHFSLTPHPANVRRRIRQLKDYLIISADWISYALIDDITDVYGPLIQSIEEEVDDIDDEILRLHMVEDGERKGYDSSEKDYEKSSQAGGDSHGGDMLMRVGEARKKVMGMYRLLGHKADVIKSFAKRCNEHWEVAPHSEIGLYLGDIQDHILTMTSNLNHYETLLSRAHSNYLAQISIRMNERQEKTADSLNTLTVLGTIVLPMNIITGMWGMNVLVPGQDVENLNWFVCITAGLIIFGLSCFFLARKLYQIV